MPPVLAADIELLSWKDENLTAGHYHFSTTIMSRYWWSRFLSKKETRSSHHSTHTRPSLAFYIPLNTKLFPSFVYLSSLSSLSSLFFYEPHRFITFQVTNFPLASISRLIQVRKLVLAQSCHATPPMLPWDAGPSKPLRQVHISRCCSPIECDLTRAPSGWKPRWDLSKPIRPNKSVVPERLNRRRERENFARASWYNVQCLNFQLYQH